MRFILAIFFSAYISGCSTSRSPYITPIKSQINLQSDSDFYLKIPSDIHVTFRGLVSYDDVEGGQYNMLYPGDTAAVFFAAVITHSVVAESVKNTQKQKLQDLADEIILPYQSSISRIKTQDLANRTVQQLRQTRAICIQTNSMENSDLIVESRPVFLMAKNEKNILLKNIIIAYSSDKPSQVVYRNMIEVLSLPFSARNAQSYWLEGNGAKLARASEEMYAESIALVIADIKNTLADSSKEKTFHYFQDGQKMYERGRLVSENNDRIAIRTLRGWLKSIPIQSKSKN